jgi:uncharacterized damage-inducible protein DinB
MADAGVELFRHNLWANLLLLDACAKLGEGDLAASAPGTYGAVRDTFVHLAASETRYVGEFDGGSNARWENEPFPGFPALRERVTASGEALLRIAEESPPDRILRGTYRGQPYEMAASILLVQAINHATEHRSHIVSILSQRGVATPRLDALAYFQAGAHD